ncbi:hypothetical protein Y1Q_0004492 [Alligator mississippiensis]|uniref:Uncharacterized protein n=1 Tax=Alligator mississippiensis TaxID=8496 RepID=A0A151NZD1_ALLMI|nr:hypothetical protein Y1Q_0004492 [Alligator mississippiensis]
MCIKTWSEPPARWRSWIRHQETGGLNGTRCREKGVGGTGQDWSLALDKASDILSASAPFTCIPGSAKSWRQPGREWRHSHPTRHQSDSRRHPENLPLARWARSSGLRMLQRHI